MCAGALGARWSPLQERAGRPREPLYAEGRRRRAVFGVQACPRRLVLNFNDRTSNYVLEVSIPTDASRPTIRILEEACRGRIDLRSCLIETLGRVRFFAHVGPPLALRIAAEGSR